MATLKEAIATILHTDAQSAEAGSLGVLLGYHATTKPDCVFFSNPPANPEFPLVTFFFSGQTERFPRFFMLNITAFGSNFEAVLKRIYTLLNDASITATDYKCLMIKWDWSGPELFDDDLKVYYCQNRYLLKGIPL